MAVASTSTLLKSFELPLHYAVIFKDKEQISQLLASDEDVNHSHQGFSPLMLSVVDVYDHVTAKSIFLNPLGIPFTFDESKPDYAVTRLLLVNGADVGARDNNGISVLSLAAEYASSEFMGILLEFGADMYARDSGGKTVLHYASNNRHDSYKIAMVLLSHGADPFAGDNSSWTAIELAVMRDEGLGVLKAIVEYGIDLRDSRLVSDNHSTLLHCFALGWSSTPTLELLIASGLDINAQNHHGQTPLHVAAVHSLIIFLKLCKYSPDANVADFLGRTALHLLHSHTGSYAMVRTLLNKCIQKLIMIGGDINKQDQFRWTPLHYAVTFGYALHSEFLLKHNPNVELKDRNDASVLHYGALNNEEKVLHVLLKHNTFCINNVDKFGSTALHYAVFHNNAQGVKQLMESGIDQHIRDKAGRNALDLAKMWNLQDMIQVLSDSMEVGDAAVHPFKSNQIQLDHKDVDANIFPPDLLPDDLETYCSSILASPFIGICENSLEAQAVKCEVLSLLGKLAHEVESHQALFAFSPKLRGSMAEGTKSGLPDEFDVMLIMNKLSSHCSARIDPASFSGYVQLDYNGKDSNYLMQELPALITSTGKLNCDRLHCMFFDVLKRCLNSAFVWMDSELMFKEFKMTSSFTNLTVCWTGPMFKHLAINIDLVPCLPLPDFDLKLYNFSWPLAIDLSSVSVYVLLVASWMSKTDLPDTLQYEVSVTEIEELILLSLPDSARHGYVLSKALRSPQVCHSFQGFDDYGIIIENKGSETLPPYLITAHKMYEESLSEQNSTAEDHIKSYALKNLLLWEVKKQAEQAVGDLGKISALEWAKRVYAQLKDSFERRDLTTFVTGANMLRSRRIMGNKHSQGSMMNLWKMALVYRPSAPPCLTYLEGRSHEEFNLDGSGKEIDKGEKDRFTLGRASLFTKVINHILGNPV